MVGDRRSERCEAGRYPCCRRRTPSTNANITGGPGTAPTPTPATMPSTSPGRIRPQVYLWTPPRRRSGKCWIPSVTDARSALRWRRSRILLGVVDERHRRSLGYSFGDAFGVPVRETDAAVRL